MPNATTASEGPASTRGENGTSSGMCDPGRLSWVRITGSDAVRFVDSFTTAAVGRLADGHGSEGFFTDVKGQVICMAGLLRCGPANGEPPAVEIVADGDIGAVLAEHLERYHIREPIEIEDVSSTRQTLGLLGPSVATLLAPVLQGRGSPADLQTPFDHAAVELAGADSQQIAARLVRCDWAGPHSWLVAYHPADADAVRQTLSAAGFANDDGSRWEQARIEAGTPRLCDLLPKTLPQELGRDARAISFTKGCYLGQETVARLDALGHVNRRLVGLRLEGDRVPLPGTAITSGSDTGGHLTSSCLSPTLNQPLVLAILPVKALTADTPLTIDGCPATPIELPLS